MSCLAGAFCMFCSCVHCDNIVEKQDALLKPMEPHGGFIRKLENGRQIWTKHSADAYRWTVNRDHLFANLPEFLKGKGYILSPMEYSESLVEKPGYVYVITPTPVEENMSGRFSKSAAGKIVDERKPNNLNPIPYFASLMEQGFERMEDVPEFKLSKTLTETVAVYRKYAEKGEVIRYGKPGWGVTIGRLPEDYKTPDKEEVKEIEFVKSPAKIYSQPGEEYAFSSRTYQGIPGIEVTAAGRLWATWVADNTGDYTEGPRNYSVFATSTDGGKTWSDPPVFAMQHPVWTVAAIDSLPWCDPAGRLWWIWTQYDVTMDKHDSWGVTAENPESANPVWSKPRQIGKGTLLNEPAVLSTGEWLFLSSPRGTPVDVYISTDKGKTISHYSQAEVPGAGWNEHMVIERKDGSLWMLVRTNKGIGETISYDRGKTWTKGELYREGTSSRFHIRRLKSGRLLLIYHPVETATTKKRNKMTAYLSEDEGKTWPYELLLYEGGGSYPDADESDEGFIYVVQDAGGRMNRMNIAFSVFTEEDIMAGKLVNKNSRLGVIISGRDKK